MSTAIAVPTQSIVRQELDVVDVIAQVKKIQLVMAEVMIKSDPDKGIEGHYGVIPGTNKPTLLQAGADKLLLTFRLDPQFEITKEWDGKHLTVYSKCVLWHIPSGLRYGSGDGSCSTKESKYAYRKGQRLCPKCEQETIRQDRKDDSWYCWRKIGGCGDKFQAGDQSIEGQSVDRVPNEDLADQYNTVLKIANKRSKVAAVLNVTAASDIFTQDMEDAPPPPPPSAGRPEQEHNSPKVLARSTGEVGSTSVTDAGKETARVAPSPADSHELIAESGRLFVTTPVNTQVMIQRCRVEQARLGARAFRKVKTALGIDEDKDLEKLSENDLQVYLRHLEASK